MSSSDRPSIPIARKAATIAALARRREWPSLVRAAARRALPPGMFWANHLVIARLRSIRPVAAELGHIRVREATGADETDCQRIHPRAEGYADRFAAGDICTLAYVRDRPAAIAWFQPGPCHRSAPDALEFQVGRAGCWSYWIEVHPEFRLRGAFLKLWVDSLGLLRARGIGTVYTGIEVANRPSMNAHLRLGFEVMFHYRVLRALGVTLHRVGPPGGPAMPRWGGWRGSDPDPAAQAAG